MYASPLSWLGTLTEYQGSPELLTTGQWFPFTEPSGNLHASSSGPLCMVVHGSACISIMDTWVLRLSGNMVFSGLWKSVDIIHLYWLYRVLFQTRQDYREEPNRFCDHRPFTIQSNVTVADTAWQMIWIIWEVLRKLCTCKYVYVSITFTLDPTLCLCLLKSNECGDPEF